MPRLISATRYLVIVPIFGLVVTAAVLFLVGGIALLGLVVENALAFFRHGTAGADTADHLPIQVEIVEYVHTFLIGTALYITAAGLFQLFIHEVPFPRWLRVDSTEELETNLIGVTVVVLGVSFMGFAITRDADTVMRYGIGIAATVAALGAFIGLRTWSIALGRRSERESEAAGAIERGTDETH